MDLKTREQLRELNAQQWADFKAHWPMEVLCFLRDFGFSAALGASLGFASAIYYLQAAA